MTYPEVLEYLLHRLPMFQRVGAAAYKVSLDNIIKLCAIAGNPEKDLKCIHIAGTNGKGSVTHILSSILQAEGYTVGAFTSPHYKDFRERIKVNAELIDEGFMTTFINEHYASFTEIDASFFEITTVMMFAFFQQKQVDYCVVETGMGGRLDSTNVITPLLSVITNISFDHMQFLGKTLQAIAKEKAGIIKDNVPVVIGERQPETASVFIAEAEKKNAGLTFAEDVVKLSSFISDFNGSKFDVILDDTLKFTNVISDLSGSFQQKNIATSLAAIQVLKNSGVNIHDDSIVKGLNRVKQATHFIGRWMVLHQEPLVIVDSAHNEGGLQELFRGIPQTGTLHIVYGSVNDKDLKPIFEILPKNAVYYFCKPDVPRGKEAAELLLEAAEYGITGKAYSTVAQAFSIAKERAFSGDTVVVTGSIFVVAEVI